VCRLRGLRSLRQIAAGERRRLLRRRRSRRRLRVHLALERRREAPALRCLIGVAAWRPVRAAASRARWPARARRAGVDRRRQPDARRAQEAARAISRQQSPPDRSRFRSQHLHARSSRHQRPDGRRSIRRRRARARLFGSDRHVHRHVREPAGARSRENHGADARHARTMGRHRLVSGSRQFLREAAEPGQAIHRDARYRAYPRAKPPAARARSTA